MVKQCTLIIMLYTIIISCSAGTYATTDGNLQKSIAPDPHIAQMIIATINPFVAGLNKTISQLESSEKTVASLTQQLINFSNILQVQAIMPLAEGKEKLTKNIAMLDDFMNSKVKILQAAYAGGVGATAGTVFLGPGGLSGAVYLGILTAHLGTLYAQLTVMIPKAKDILSNARTMTTSVQQQLTTIDELIHPQFRDNNRAAIAFGRSPSIYKEVNNTHELMKKSIQQLTQVRTAVQKTVGSESFAQALRTPFTTNVEKTVPVTNEATAYAYEQYQKNTEQLVITKAIATYLFNEDVTGLSSYLKSNPSAIQKACKEIMELCTAHKNNLIALATNMQSLFGPQNTNAFISNPEKTLEQIIQTLKTTANNNTIAQSMSMAAPLLPMLYEGLSEDESLINLKHDLSALYHGIILPTQKSFFSAIPTKDMIVQLETAVKNAIAHKPFTIEPMLEQLLTIAHKSIPLLIFVPALMQKIKIDGISVLTAIQPLLPQELQKVVPPMPSKAP